MKKTLKKIVAILCATTITLTAFAGCDDKSGNDKYELWTTYHTLKVVQDPALNENYEKMPVGINIEMSQNESEMGSFYVTTGNKAVESFNLTLNDLTNERGDVLPTSQMKVYAQKYVNVVSKSQGNALEEYPLGMTPDPLVPIDLYKNEGEDKIGANKNQGFSVDFTTTSQTPSGTYTGSFTLTLDNKTENIPVSVEVWDFNPLPEGVKSSCMSSMAIYDRQVRQSEGCSTDTEEFDHWYTTYYEQALNYKMNAWTVPFSLDGADAFLASVKKYWNHPNFATYGMPHHTFISGTESVYMEYYRDCLYTFAVASAQDKKDYLSLCYFYPYDEPETQDGINESIVWITKLRALFNEVQTRLEEERVFEDNGCTAEFTQQCKNSLLNMEIVITAVSDEPLLEEYNFTYCPELNHWGDSLAAENLYAHAEEFDTSLWYYNHFEPNWPCPTVHIDDFWLSTRIMKWFQKQNDLDGWLYYDYASALWSNVRTNEYHGTNRYENINRTKANGDGFFVYPAAKYEADEPIISMRLVAYRDGQDDLDMLNYLDTIYSEYEKFYGVEKGTLDVNKVIKGLYDKIICNAFVYDTDSKVFNEIRTSVKDLILNAKKENGNKFVYVVDYDNDIAKYYFYTEQGYQVKVGGQVLSSVVSGQGLKHTYEINFSNQALLSTVEVVKDGQSETFNLFEVSTKGIDVTSSDFEVELSADSSCTVNNQDKALDFVIKSKDFGVGNEILTVLFVPSIEFKSIGNFNVLEYTCENKNSQAVKMMLTIVATDGSTMSHDVGLPANTIREIKFQNRLFGKQLASVSIEFQNIDSSGYTLGDREIRISNLRVR